MADNSSITGRNSIEKNGAGRRGAHARRIDQILQSDGNAVQKAAPTAAIYLFGGTLGVAASRLRGYRDEPVKGRIIFFDRVKACVGQFKRGYFSGTKLLSNLQDGHCVW